MANGIIHTTEDPLNTLAAPHLVLDLLSDRQLLLCQQARYLRPATGYIYPPYPQTSAQQTFSFSDNMDQPTYQGQTDRSHSTVIQSGHLEALRVAKLVEDCFCHGTMDRLITSSPLEASRTG